MGKKSKIGKSILKRTPPPQRMSKRELEQWQEMLKEIQEQKRAEEMERKVKEGLEGEKVPRATIPGEKPGGERPAEEKRPFGMRILPLLEGAEVEVKEVKDKRLKKGKKTRIDIKQLATPEQKKKKKRELEIF